MLDLIRNVLGDIPWYAWPLCFIYAVAAINFLYTLIMGMFEKDDNDDMLERSLEKKRNRR